MFAAHMTVRFLKFLAICLAITVSVNGYALKLNAQHVIVVSDQAGQVLFAKNADVAVPIASLTKLLTAMVILDSKPDMNEKILIGTTDMDALKHSRSHVPVGATLTRREAFQLALMSSDNRAAAALARTYRGGYPAFIIAVNEKLMAELSLFTTPTIWLATRGGPSCCQKPASPTRPAIA